MSDCDQTNGRIPQHCADEFGRIQRDLGTIQGSIANVETKIDGIAQSQKTFGDRAWVIIKALCLAAIGFFVGGGGSSKPS